MRVGRQLGPQHAAIAGHFDGEIRHSVSFRHGDEFRGKRVLVLGAGNSGADIACEAAMHAQRAFLSVRRGYHFIPKHLMGFRSTRSPKPVRTCPCGWHARSFRPCCGWSTETWPGWGCPSRTIACSKVTRCSTPSCCTISSTATSPSNPISTDWTAGTWCSRTAAASRSTCCCAPPATAGAARMPASISSGTADAADVPVDVQPHASQSVRDRLPGNQFQRVQAVRHPGPHDRVLPDRAAPRSCQRTPLRCIDRKRYTGPVRRHPFRGIAAPRRLHRGACIQTLSASAAQAIGLGRTGRTHVRRAQARRRWRSTHAHYRHRTASRQRGCPWLSRRICAAGMR
ncbi:hypothetical protein INP48_00385 [Xanthomonas perforans]|nr:hypothetical protein [Xanthomonas perforans]